MNRHVDFLIAGTQKGGTTALDTYLRAHPDICMAQRSGPGITFAASKETHFFDTEEYFTTSTVDYSRYHCFFAPRPQHCLLGESTPIYMYWHDAPRRIWQYNPDIKLIVLLRNPIDRAYSHWNMEQARGAEDLPFAEAIARERERCRAALPLQHRVYSYLDRGFYSEQLRRLWRFFPERQVLVLKSEDLRARPQAVVDRVCAFLDLPPLRLEQSQSVHQGTYSAPMSASERAWLHDFFYYEIKTVEKMLGWDCGDWLAPEYSRLG